MGAAVYPVELTATAFSFTLSVLKDSASGFTGVTGQAPTVALRDASTTDKYLDFADYTMKTVGWTEKFLTLTEASSGYYLGTLNPSAMIPALVQGTLYVAEFAVTDGPLGGLAHDLLMMVNSQEDLTLLRRMAKNRFEEYPAAGVDPGYLILFADDGVTPLLTWQLRDATGGPVTATVGAPARRTAASP
jgi:hypothetical protein